MTTLDAQQKILEHLLSNDSITISDVDKYISTIKNEAEKTETKAAMLSSIDELCASGILMSPKPDELRVKGVYVLKKPIMLYEQTLVIDGDVALRISNIVKNFSELINSKEITTNPLGIKQQDIIVLMDIIGMYASNSEDSKDEELPKSRKNV